MSLTVESLRQARALAKAWNDAPGSMDTGRIFLDVIEAYDELNNAITWDTSCLNCASLLDRSYESYVLMEEAQEALLVSERYINSAEAVLTDGIADEISHQEWTWRERVLKALGRAW